MRHSLHDLRLVQVHRSRKRFYLLVIGIAVLLIWMTTSTTGNVEGIAVAVIQSRSFAIDYKNNQFLKDGKSFRFIAGSFHYFRALPQTWQRKLRTMRSAGLNAVTTYVEWSLHNPIDGVYNWKDIADLELFIRLAIQEDLLVILRPGPFICAERDNGGFPYWLFNKYPDIRLRTSDKDYQNEVHKWYKVLMNKMRPYLYGNGGPIIMVQVENEYGSFSACDRKYSLWLKQETEMYVKDKAVLFTNDGPGPEYLTCGKIPDVLATIDYRAASEQDMLERWKVFRKYQPQGPLVNMEFYPGWLTHWQEPLATLETKIIVDGLKVLLNANVSVNFYMFYGGTNFGFTAGANNGGPGGYQADITSYDYDAPMDESGEPTSKFMALRAVILEYLPRPNVSVPEPLPKMKLPDVRLIPSATLLSDIGREILGTKSIFSSNPVTFEQLNQFSGFVLYETTLPHINQDPSNLYVHDLRDRAHVLIDGHLIGIQSRENQVNSTSITANSGSKLQILVESQGRINFIIANDFKGILGDVELNKEILSNWTITGFPLDKYKQIYELIQDYGIVNNEIEYVKTNKELLREGPTIFSGLFDIPLDEDKIFDTYLNPTGWGKGIVFINGFNLGRYWPVVGPQITLYLPKELLKSGKNELVIIELQTAPENGVITFNDKPLFSVK